MLFIHSRNIGRSVKMTSDTNADVYIHKWSGT